RPRLRFGLGVATALHLEIPRTGKAARPGARELCRAGCVAREQCLADVSVLRARQRDEPLADEAAVLITLVEPLGTQLAATAVFVLDPRAAEQPAQAQVSGAIAREQQHPERTVAVGLVRQPRVDTADRLESTRTRGLVELHPTEQV